ncbi:hypothetical protein X805_05260 [Sphaerotilus natans subsp. natans DSM 6575]|uniref:Amidohydrolase-related domain-containing protein n=1 Tax=Sphaerotilus natans subsp. natans DSM 6575 TaxID=1286631 RepID=A0A059KRN0_9BURK|nr:amidohydrolase family protein [Sphaerotilus natans]KDB53894.1 hypothetical protein X805_05260 [Sphaerotilus natans subsp. natans DSM 6575]SIR23496.1 Predicted metal-dependent hydrolase, TIM-barrel fold [Sphaerotilus natans]
MSLAATFWPPAGSVDAHVHLMDPAFAFAPTRRYTPAPATVTDLRAHLQRIGMQRVVCVQPSVYGSDNRCLCDGLARLGAAARGVAVLAPSHSEAEISALVQAGVRGVRLNLAVNRHSTIREARQEIEQAAAQMAAHPELHLQLHVRPEHLLACLPQLSALQRPVVLDHHALLPLGQDGAEMRAQVIAALRASPDLWVKLSGPYQISARAAPYGDVAPLARALIEAAPARVLWGSDWPHPAGAHRAATAGRDTIEPFRQEDDAAQLAALRAWLADDAVLQALLVDNPARLYGWSAA